MLGGVNRIVTSERNVTLSHSVFRAFLEKASWRFSDRIIANAEGVKEVLVARIGIPAEKIAVVYNGVHIESFSNPDLEKKNALRYRIMGDEEGIVIGFLGRIVEQKGLEYLVEALRIIRKREYAIPMKVALFGEQMDYKYMQKLRTQIESARLQQEVMFFGVEKDVSFVLAAFDLFVLPSLWEGFPNVLVEAMAAGKPVIATRIVDNAKIVNEPLCGLLASPADPEDLAEKILLFCAMSPQDREVMGQNARLRVKTEYSIQRLVDETIDVYRGIGIC
jgi:glycosyltransferase involved in cell wall biosynthesis